MTAALRLDPALDPALSPTRAVSRSLYAVPSVPALPRKRLRTVPTPDAASARADVHLLHAPAGREAVAPLRLTRRGLVVVALAVALLGAAVCWLAALSSPASTAAGSTAASGSRVSVRSGDTLWAIASRIAPQADPRSEVDALQHVNHLRGAALVPGQSLLVP